MQPRHFRIKKDMRTIIFYCGSGQGFKSPADAIARELEARGVQAETVDMFQAAGMSGWDGFFKNNWRFLLKHPWLFLSIYGLTNSFLVDILYPLMLPSFRKKFAAYMADKDLDFIVSTNFATTWLLARYEPIVANRLPLFGYNSDVLLSHRAYIQNRVKAYFISTELGKKLMVDDGMRPELVHITGFPIDPKFKQPKASQAETRRELGLEDIFTLLVTFGGEGIGDIRLIEMIAERSLDIQVVTVCGRNEALKTRLEALKSRYPRLRLVIVGFTTRLQDYLHACDISAGKSGLNTAFESIYMKKPFLVLMAMANERHCARFVAEHNYGYIAKGPRDAYTFLEAAMKGSERFLSIKKALDTPPCRFDIADMADLMLEIAGQGSRAPKSLS